ncbi:MAG: hypothetical protein IPK27_20960 [Rhodanobacteraceae bacterium]|nr:hypothetical protein [Rhodanobacteraceae bacterium]
MNFAASTRKLLRAGIAGLYCVAFVGCASPKLQETLAAGEVPRVEIVPREERRELPPGTTGMRIENPHGDLRVRITDQPKVGYYATVQRIGEQPLEPVFDWQQHGERLELTIRYPGEESWLRTHGHSRGRVDLAVFVPAAVALDLRTTDGFLQVRKARASVRARTESGSIEVSGAADLDLRSATGAIAASQTSGHWRTPIELHTRSGRIAVAVPVYAGISVDAMTRGRIELEPGFTGSVFESGGKRRLQAKFGDGGRAFRSRSDLGEIFLRAGIPESVLQQAVDSGD